jgi:hypothetical protein
MFLGQDKSILDVHKNSVPFRAIEHVVRLLTFKLKVSSLTQFRLNN